MCVGVERAGDLERDDAGPRRGGGGERGERVQRAGGDHLPGAVDVRRGEPVPFDRVGTSSGFPPSTALMPVGVTALAAAIARPRSRTRTSACSAVSTPAEGRRGELADRVAGDGVGDAGGVGGPSSVPGATAGRVTSAAATSSGCATAVSRIVSASEVVPWATRSRPATALSHRSRSATSGISSQGARKPGVWEP